MSLFTKTCLVLWVITIFWWVLYYLWIRSNPARYVVACSKDKLAEYTIPKIMGFLLIVDFIVTPIALIYFIISL